MDGPFTKSWQAFHDRELRGDGWSVYAKSQTGIRHAINEDNHLIVPLTSNHLLVAVADGLGGHPAGELASGCACATLHECAKRGMLRTTLDTEVGVGKALQAMAYEAHLAIVRYSRNHAALEGMGCTLTMAVVNSGRAWFCHLGDSRLYWFGNNSVRQLTRDHSSVSQPDKGIPDVAERPGGLSGRMLDQALGLEDPTCPLDIQVGTLTLRPGNNLLLCTDGLSEQLADQDLADIVSKRNSTVKRVHDLIDTALRAGSVDDVTAILVNLGTT